MKYSHEHGDYVVGRSQQTIMFSGRGPWNDETLMRGTKEMGASIEQLDFSKPWGCLSCLYGESLMPPSTFKAFAKQTIIRKSLGLKGLAVVILNSDIAHTIESQLTQAYQPAGVDFEFLKDVDSAIDWLCSRGIELDKVQAEHFFKSNAFVPF